MEELLHYVWKHKIFPLKELQTTAGLPIEVLDAGLPNKDAGPDFFNAKIKMNGTVWVGNIEIHRSSSDWFRHGHDKNKGYDSVILHVAENIDCEVICSDGRSVPQIQLSCPEHIKKHYEELSKTDGYPCCYKLLSSLSPLVIHSWLSALQSERLKQKRIQLEERLKKCEGNWEDTFFITLARNFGFGLNGEALEKWAWLIPLRAIDKHRDNLFQIEAIFFGIAGLLHEELQDEYYKQLQREYNYLAYKFQFREADPSLLRFLRIRPGNFPHIRIAQLAFLLYREHHLFSRIIEAESLQGIKTILKTATSEYWKTHYNFLHTSFPQTKTLTDTSLNLIIVNTVVPCLYAYGCHKANALLCERAGIFLDELKAEDNHIIRLWDKVGLSVKTASDSQALLQLKKEYCDKKKCLYCRIGYEYLKRKEN